MRRTLVIALGTAASGAALHFRHLREAELRQLERRLVRASLAERSAIERRVRELTQSIRLLAIDLDGTGAYRLPPPLCPGGAAWGVGELLKLTLNPRDILERFQAGNLPDVDQVNPETIRGLDAENASGGARPNADLAFQVSADRVRSAIREALVELLKGRGASFSSKNHGVRVFLVFGTYGGTGSGGYDRVRLCLLRVADELGVHLDVYPFPLLPGAHAPKDPGTSYANTFAAVKEMAADATGHFWRFERGSPMGRRGGFRTPFAMSDINNAPCAPQVTSETAGTAVAGHALYSWATTELGDHIDALIGDFSVAGTTPTSCGEPRQLGAIGYAEIVLDGERQAMWSTSSLGAGFVEKASTAAPESLIRRDVRTFLEGNALVLDHGRNDLSTRLLEQCAVHEHLSLPRVRSLFTLATQELGGFQILGEGRNRLDLALQQCGDFGPALQRHAITMGNHAGCLISTEVRRLLTDHNRGPASASLWLAVMGGVFDAMLAAAGENVAQLEIEIGEVDLRIRQTETEYAERLRGRGFLYRALHEGEVSRLAAVYRVDLETWAILKIRSQAASAGIQVLNELRQAVQRELQNTAEPIAAALPACLERFREDRRRAASHSVEFACPNGLPLLVTEADLIELHTRCFSKADEAQVITDLFSLLAQATDAIAILKDSNALTNFIQTAAPRTLIGVRLAELNVVDELRRRYPDSAALGSVLRERDFEAYERLPLVSTADQADGVTIARLFGVDGTRLESVRLPLDQNQSDRGVRYLPVDTGDRERITFMQVRAVVPFSDWRGYAIARAHYEAVRSESESEKQHVIPGNRFLPCPGVRLADDDVALALVRAWVLDRLRPTDDGRWTVLPASRDDTPVVVSWPFAIPPQLAYRLSVDLVSSTSCMIRMNGPSVVRERLSALVKSESNGFDGAKFLPDPEMLRRAVSELQCEVDWWERNTHAASFSRRAGGVGR